MVYSEVVNNGWILPYKEKYTIRDVNKVLTDSLFSERVRTFTEREAAFVVICSAVFWDTDWSEAVSKTRREKMPI